MPEQFRAATTSLFKGVITDTNGKPLKASIIWEDIESSAHLGLLSSDPVTGEFTITLPLGRRYEYFVEADGFVPKSGIFDLANAKSSQTKRDSIALYSIEEAVDDDIAMGLTNILFEPSKADLKPESAGEIKHIAMFLKSNPHLNIEIAGHADASGSAASNQTLSQQRAETVKAEILKYGIPSFKIIAKGYGNSKPISSINGLNRRVEFRIIKN